MCSSRRIRAAREFVAEHSVGRRKANRAMGAVILHFVLGTLGCLAVFLVFIRLSGIGSFSAPFGLVFFGVVCAALAHYVSPWGTPAVIAIYALLSAHELRQERRAQKAERKNAA